MDQAYRFIKEDEVEHYRLLSGIAPLAQTPMDKRSANSYSRYAKKFHRQLDQMTPWKKKGSRLRESLRGKVKPGEVVVVLGGDESSKSPLYSGASIKRE